VAFFSTRTARHWWPGKQFAGDVEAPAHESALDAAELLAVQKDIGLPVDAVEVEPRTLSGMPGAVNSVRYQKSE
jgi:hypothetical protein